MSSIKLTADSGGGTFEIKAPSSSGNTRVLTLPDTGNITLSDGITMVDQWRINSNFNSQNEVISFNWERVDNIFAQIGTGMSYNSGIFSFPQTGIYLVEFHAAMFKASAAVRYMGVNLQITEDNSNYTTRAEGYGNVSNNSTSYAQAQVKYVIDVSDISNIKVRFKSDSETTVGYAGATDENRTVATFIRLGDT
tara:strand:- start:286 stop:867 length:582 start_codon:yes stop_codon:yes gene_type:complete